jgi:predicted choloylglycine hydrolase
VPITHTKTFRFVRLPAPCAAPGVWRDYLDSAWGDFSRRFAPPAAVPTAEVRAAMARDLPALLPDFDALVDALPEWEPAQIQALANWNLTPFFDACSIARSVASGHPTLLRNYDIGVDDHRGIFHLESRPDGHWILGSAEGGWGFLDGVNDRGLTAAMAFGGSFAGGQGWSIPVLMRYMLANFGSADEGADFLERVPHTMCQNFLLLDKSGRSNVVHTSADRGVTVIRGGAECTNHQGEVLEPRHAEFTCTVERLECLQEAAGSLRLSDMLRPPVYSTRFKERFGTVYSVEHDPVLGTAHYAWPGADLFLTPQSPETEMTVDFTEEETET